jgi:hypothetical protein
VVIRERRVPIMNVNPGTLEHLTYGPVEPRLHIPFVTKEICNSCFSAEREIHAIEISKPRARQCQSCLAECLTWCSAGVDTCTAEFPVAVNESYAPSEVGGGNRTGDSGWAATDHNQIIVFSFHPSDRFLLLVDKLINAPESPVWWRFGAANPNPYGLISPFIENDADRYGLQVFAMRVVEGMAHPMIDSVSARDFGVSATIVAPFLNQRSNS